MEAPRAAARQFTGVLVIGALACAVAVLGARPLPAELSPLRPSWDFTSDASPWSSRNSRLFRTPDGMVVVPSAAAATISSGQMDHDPAAFGRMHLRLKVRDATQGRVGLVLTGRDGPSRVLVPFEVPGGDAFSDVDVLLPATGRSDARVVEVILVPSLRVQPVVVAAIAFEPGDANLAAAIKELGSPAPGETTALSGFAMHTLPPPVIGGRSVWVILTPLVLLAGVLGHLGGGTSRWRHVLQRSAGATVVAVWGVGFLFLFYHQFIALGVDVRRFGGVSRAEAYQVIDSARLWEDMVEVARRVPSGSALDFKTDSGEDRVVSIFWEGRAAYYLYPIVVRNDAPVKVVYFGRAHPPCSQVAAAGEVMQDAIRYCLFRARTSQ